jgi:hypothetical protein
MARLARVIAVGVPHHITQRGNARRFILQEEERRRRRKVYLDLLRHGMKSCGVGLIGYCLMANQFTLSPSHRGPIDWLGHCRRHTAGLLPTATHSTTPPGMFGRAATIPVPWTSPTCGGPYATRS